METQSKYCELCILIPCYNNIDGLRRSLESIRYYEGQYLIVVVDDGSSQPVTNDLLAGINVDELPLHIIRLQENKGITTALNTGLTWITANSKCKYIARLDCGDTCFPERFFKQIDFLRVNTDVALLGSWCYFQDQKKNSKYNYKAPVHHQAIQNELYFRNVFIHPTVVFRTAVLDKVGLYPEDFPHAEDYALFWKIANLEKTAILPSYLVVCEVNTTGISFSNRIKQLRSRMVIVKKFGHKFARRQLGILKLRILMKMPYSFVLYVKKLISF